MKVKIEINTDNSAFHNEQGNPDVYYRNLEVAAILRHLADKLEIYAQAGVKKDEGITLMDINGNSVGKCEFIDEDDQVIVRWCEKDPVQATALTLVPLRKRAGLTQKQVAEKMRMSTSFVSSLEREAPWHKIMDIAAYTLACGYILDLVFTNADGSLDEEEDV